MGNIEKLVRLVERWLGFFDVYRFFKMTPNKYKDAGWKAWLT